MLNIAVRKDEKVFMEIDGKKAEVMVKGFNGTKYVLGFEASKDIKIIREKNKGKEIPKENE